MSPIHCTFDAPVGKGPVLDETMSTISAPTGHMPNEYGPVVGTNVCNEGCAMWSFTIQGHNEVGLIAVGVADASVPLTPSTGPAATAFHLGKAKASFIQRTATSWYLEARPSAPTRPARLQAAMHPFRYWSL